MPRYCSGCFKITPDFHVDSCPHCKIVFDTPIHRLRSSVSLRPSLSESLQPTTERLHPRSTCLSTSRKSTTSLPNDRPISTSRRSRAPLALKSSRSISSTSLHRPEPSITSISKKSLLSRRLSPPSYSKISSDSFTEKKMVERFSGSCQYKIICGEYLSSLKWDENYFNRQYNRCYCSKCYPMSFNNTYEIGGSTYVIPRGWCRFGLHVDHVRAQIDNIWDKWIISYHGTSTIAAQSIIAHRQFLIPGDKCIDGSRIEIRPGHIKDKYEIYTSPAIDYSSHPCYCRTQKFQSKLTNKLYSAQIVLQCRQKPGTFNVQGETVGAGSKRICSFIPNDQIEFLTKTRAAIVPYALLIRLTDI